MITELYQNVSLYSWIVDGFILEYFINVLLLTSIANLDKIMFYT
jgi:hypothetical protein